MHTMLAGPFHLDSLADISPRPLTITEGPAFTYLGKQVNKGVAMATETHATAAPQGAVVTAHLEHGDCELTHTPWAGWYCETAAD
ncbi:hypothetical protein QFZ69_004666 [Arthrobacter sp. V1I7]|uniref:hypothetical protein n=1 Tax=Arthrobacter sp. V1I7 TaxID=3042274 RepID=UPI002783ECC1|nr:hypothetical protein [Arthrobacter sp. V1I7]MDQ0823720.1 hypothetical protein [Arthrobacter sp. V1I7]